MFLLHVLVLHFHIDHDGGDLLVAEPPLQKDLG
jgi:hypothetical protein